MNTICPRCGQGSVKIAKVRARGERVQVCDECEAVWMMGDEPSALAFQDLTTVLRARGIDGNWEQLDAE